MKFFNTEFMKKCKRCKEVKPLNDYYKDKSSDDGYCMTCKLCKSETSKTKSRTVLGLIEKMYWHQVGSSKSRGFNRPLYSKQEFIEWVIFNPSFKDLYYNWVKSDYKKELVPSVDRINDYKGYEFGNIQLMTWSQNRIKGAIDRFNGINTKLSKSILVYKKGKLFKTFKSIAIASRELNIERANIQSVLSGKFKQTNGYVFFYANESKKIIEKRKDYCKNNNGVIGIHKTTGEILEFDSIKEAQLKTKSFNISEVCVGNRKSSNGFNWKFKMEEPSY